MILLKRIAYLHLMLILSIYGTQLQDQCTQGFMDYPRLSIKASQINVLPQVPIRYSNVEYRNTSSKVALMVFFTNSIAPDADGGYTIVFPNLGFECPGTITGFLLPLNIRIPGANSTEEQYPWIGIFRVNDSDTFTLVPDSNRSILLGPDDFSTSGLYNYTISPPIQFTSGDILGLYLYLATGFAIIPYMEYALDFNISTTETFVIVETNNTDYNDDEMHRQYTRVKGVEPIHFNRFLIRPIISVEDSTTTNDSSCLSGFIGAEELLPFSRAAGGITADINHETLYYKNINFTCDGNITHVVIGLQDIPFRTSVPPEIRIWRPVNDTYTQSGPTIPLYYNDAVSDISTKYLRWYNLSVPVPVTQGDVLGIYNPPLQSSDSVLYFQLRSGPFSYLSSGVQSPVNHYPLVSVIFDGAPIAAALSITTTSSAKPSSTLEAAITITTTTLTSTTMTTLNISSATSSLITISITSPPPYPDEGSNPPVVKIVIVILTTVLAILLVISITIAGISLKYKSAKVVNKCYELGNVDTFKIIKLTEEDKSKGGTIKSVPLIKLTEDDKSNSESIHMINMKINKSYKIVGIRGTTANESYGMLDISQCNQSYSPIDSKGESNEPYEIVNEVTTSEYEPVPVLNEAYNSRPDHVPSADSIDDDTMVTNESYASFDMIPLAQNESYNIMNEGTIQHTTHDGSSDRILLQSNESYSAKNLPNAVGVDIYSDSVLYEGREEVCSSEKLERQKAAGTNSHDDNDMDIPLQPNESYTANTQHTLTHATSTEDHADTSDDIKVNRNEAYNNRPYDDLDIPIQPNESYTANTQHTLTHSQTSIDNREDTSSFEDIKVDHNEAYNKMERVDVVSNEYIAVRPNASYSKFSKSSEELNNGSSIPAMYDGDCNPYSDVLVVKPNKSYHSSMVQIPQLTEANDSTQNHGHHDDSSGIAVLPNKAYKRHTLQQQYHTQQS